MPRWTILLLLVTAAPARAEPAWLGFTTWLRDAPRPNARIIDELQSGERLERLACNAGWCRVMAGGAQGRVPGYVPEPLLAAAPPGRVRPASTDCFPAQHFTPAGPLALRVCPALPR